MSALREYAVALNQPTLGGGGQYRYDEVVGPDGGLRSSWKGLAEIAVSVAREDLQRAHETIVTQLADDGVTYSRPGERARPWTLDPIPLILDHEQWAPLEVGLAQRAELLNAILADIYGQRRVLRDGLVPPAAVLAHPGFLRVLARPGYLDPAPLVVGATDLGRDEHGDWHVLADRTQAPSGLGYAMENRRVVSRTMPELYRASGLHRMEPFFSAVRSALLQAGPADHADPRVVVLSPGSQSETAYDQAFLASALGFPLVQGSDLVVRADGVQMKVFGRLERVDVILRRVDSAWSDPLELRGDSQLGIAGLVEAVRRGRVTVVNGLGSGVLENPALMPYLPDVCEALLGEPLRLPSIETHWGGDPDGLEWLLDHVAQPDQMTLRSLDATTPLDLHGDRQQILDRVLAEPHRYVAQRRLPLSQAPTFRPSLGTTPHALTLRSFAVRYGSSYRTLVGGLVSLVDGERTIGSKDLWVLKGDPGDADQGLADVLPLTNVRASISPVPRMLDDMFWFGRYAERTEDLLRVVLATHTLAEDYRSRPRSAGSASLNVMLGAVTRLAGQQHPDDLDAEFRSILLDQQRLGSVAHTLDALRSVLAGVRDQLSLDTWRVFGATGRAAHALAQSRHGHQIAESAGRMLTGILALQGVTASMIRDAGWHMMGTGRALERSIQLVHLLNATTTVRHGMDVDQGVLNATLAAAESSVTHRRRYRGNVRIGGVLELLLLDADNPRSLAFSLAELADHLGQLPASTGSTRPERLVADLIEEVGEADVAALVAIGGTDRPNLRTFLDGVAANLDQVGAAIAELHIASGPAPRALTSLPLVSSLELEPEPDQEVS